jgi:hypothetical protein
MGTAVLSGKADVLEADGVGADVLEAEGVGGDVLEIKDIWGKVVAKVDDPSKSDNVFVRLAHRWRQKGYDAEVVYENDDDLDIGKYLGEDFMRYLDSVELDENWNKKHEKNNKPVIR